MTDPKSRRHALVVIGMHRSGTSAMARVLSLAGAALPRDVMGSGPFNEAGHWEPLPIAEFNDRLLGKVDAGWDSMFGPRRNRRGALPLRRHVAEARRLLREQYGDEPLIVVKDPRLTLLVDFWEEALRAEGFEPSYVIMVRRPEEVAASLAARDGMSVNRAMLLWATYMSQADILTRPARRIFCSYDGLLVSPESMLDSIEDNLGVEFSRRTAKSAAETADFLKPSLRHHSAEELAPPSGELTPVAELAAYLADIASGIIRNDDVAAETQAWLRSLESIVAPILTTDQTRAQAATEAAEARIAELTRRFGEANGLIAELQEQRDALRAGLDEHAVALAGRERDIASLEETVAAQAQTGADLAAARGEIERLGRTNDALVGLHVSALARRELGIQTLRGTLAEVEASLQAERERSAALAEALAVAGVELSEARRAYEQHVDSLHEQVAAIEAARHEAAVEKAEAQEALAITRGEFADARQAFEDFRVDVAAHHALHVDSLHEQVAAIEAARHEAAVRKADAEEALAITRSEFADARQAFEDFRVDVAAHHALHVDSLHEQVAAIEAARHEAAVQKARSEEALAITRGELAEARQAFDDFRVDLAARYERQVDALQEQVAATETARHDAAVQKAGTEEALAITRGELAEARQAFDDFRVDLTARYERQFDTLQDQIAATETARHEAAVEKAGTEEALAITRGELAEARQAFDDFRVDIAARYERHVDTLHDQIAATEAARHDAAVQKAGTEEALAITRGELAEARQAFDDFRVDIAARYELHAGALHDQVAATEAARHEAAVEKAEAQEALAITRGELAEARQAFDDFRVDIAARYELHVGALHDQIAATEAARHEAAVQKADTEEALAITRFELAEAREAAATTHRELAEVRQLLTTESAGLQAMLAAAREQLLEADRMHGEARSAVAEEQTKRQAENAAHAELLREAEERAAQAAHDLALARADAERLAEEAERLREENKTWAQTARKHAARLTDYERGLLGRAEKMLRRRSPG